MNRIVRPCFTAIRCLISLIVIVYAAGCSRETKTYDELVSEDRVESIARKQYSQFFKSVERLGEPENSSTAESFLSERITQAASATDHVISDFRSFPSTFQSRISLDALSYAARDLA